MKTTMMLEAFDSWPVRVRDFLAGHYDMLLAHAARDQELVQAHIDHSWPASEMPPTNQFFDQREQAMLALADLLVPHVLRGWHCTRLIQPEIEDIRQNGMHLPNLVRLRQRIQVARGLGMMDTQIAERLLAENQANDEYRRDRIWFVFFTPHLAGQDGIERFFRRWGGEALYNSHERDAVSGEFLKAIGRPCVVEADVPIDVLSGRITLANKLIRRYLAARGFDMRECMNHEDQAMRPIPAGNIVRLVFRDDPDFAVLTGCDEWAPPLPP